MAEELAVVYVPIVPETSKIAPGVRSALGGAAKYAERDGAGIGSKLSTGIGKTLKTGAVATGAAVAGVLGAAMTKGFQRLTAIDSAEAKLSGLGHTAGGVASIMDDALAAVKGTAFGLGDAASAAASAVASGVKPGQDLQRTLKLMGDAAAIAGTDLGSMAGIFNKVAASGKLQGDVLAQLGDAGIPIIQLLAQEMGVTAGEITKLAAEGKIGFDELRNAIETGMGGAALAAGQTFSGAMDNAGAALGRLGAAALEPFFDDARDGVVGFTGVIDNLTDRVGPAAQALRDWLGPAAGSVVGFVRDLRAEATSLGPVMSNTTSTFSLLLDTALSLAPSIATITTELLKVTGAISIATWQTLLSVLTGTAAVADATLVPALNVLAGVLESSELASLAFGAALLGLVKGKAILDGFGKVSKPLATAATTLQDYAGALGEVGSNVSSVSRAHPEMTKLGIATKLLGDNGQTGFAQITAGADSARQRVTAFGEAHRLAATQARAQALAATDAFTTIDRMGSQAWHGTVAAASSATRGMATAVGGLKGTVTAAFTGMKGAATGLMNAMGGPWGVAMAGAAVAVGVITAAYGEAKQSAENMARAASSAVQAQRELAQEVAGTTGAIGQDGMAAATELATARLEQFYEEGQKGRGVTLVLREIAARVPFVSKGFYDATESARAAAGSYELLEDKAGELDYTMEDVARVAAEGGPKFAALRQAVLDTGAGSERAAEQLDEMRAEQQKLVDQARQVSPAQAEVSAAIQDIADKAGNAETRVENYWSALQKLTGNAPDLTEANANLRAELDSLAGQFTVAEGEVSEFAGATLNASGQLDTLNNTASGAVFNAMNDLGQRMREAAIAGGDANDIWAAAQPALQGLAESSGLGYDAIRQLAEQMNMTPRDLLISAQVAADPALAQANTLKQMLETVPDVVGTNMFVTGGPEAMQVLDDVGIKYKVLNEDTGQIEITAVADDAMSKLDDIIGKKADLDSLPPSAVEAKAITENAQAALDDIARQLGEVDGTTASPTLDVDPISFNDGMVGANGQLDAFDFRFVNATADLDTMPLDWNAGLAHGTITGVDDRHAMASSDLDNLLLGVNAGVAHGTLDGVDGRRPLPVSDLLNHPLNANAGIAHGTLTNLDGQRPKPIADLDNTGVRTGAQDSRNWLQQLINDFGNFALNVRLNVVRSIRDIFSSEGGNAAGGTIGALASGGSILDLRRGGQLPTYGPGSNITDGFLGIDSQGSPIVRVDAGEEVVNAKQSAKHRTFIKALNRGDRRAEQAAELTGLETGGTIGSREGLDRALREAKSSHDIGARYQWGGISREAADCSGFVGRVAWAAQGRDPDRAGRMGTTDTMLAGRWPGFRPGRQGPFIVGVNSAHMAATVDGIPVESGGDVGGPSVGEGDGANDPQFSQWYSLAHDFFSPPYANKPSITESSESLEYGESGSRVTSTSEGDGRAVALSPEASAAAESGSNDKDSPFYGTGSDSWSGLAGNLASAFVSGQVASLLSVLGISDQLPPIMKAGKTWYQQVEDDATPQEIQRQDEAIAQTAEPDAVAPSTADSGAAAAVVDPASATYATPQEAAKAALRPRGWDTGANWAGVDFIYRKESGWNPLAENPSSGAWGLPQLNPASGTLQQYLPDKSPDPFKQTQAGAQYIEDRYGDPVEAEKFWRANNWYDRGGRANGVGHMLKNTLEPERVLSPDQTRAFEDLVYGQLPDLSGLAESLTKAAVSGAAGPAAGMANAVVPGSGAVVSAAAGPAGELAGWYSGEVAGNVQYAAEEFGRDLMAIPTSMLDSITDVVMPAMPQMPQWQMPLMPELPQEPANRGAAADRRGRYGNGDVHFHVRDDQDAYMKGRLLAMREHRGLIGV
ncbi:tail length tape measure protein [Corynebacterium phage Juicebox]|uniref:Tape measure protein n=1 Tax=Corynebacterium phage Juicebox TaxID=2301600 RepID=A0A385UEL0_9CAUD|nr:tail length tape measure protein [Corynebacterium phage Juicebox]AYB69446.1 tape measure protein [Corynebacterium phage Juicebox]